MGGIAVCVARVRRWLAATTAATVHHDYRSQPVLVLTNKKEALVADGMGTRSAISDLLDALQGAAVTGAGVCVRE